MKRIVSIMVIITIAIQSIGLYLFFYDKLATYPASLVDIVWIGSALFAILFGVVCLKLNKEAKIPTSTIINVALLGIIGFQFMLFKNWVIVLLLIMIAIGLHFYRYGRNKFAIFPVLSLVMGAYLIGLFILIKGITSM